MCALPACLGRYDMVARMEFISLCVLITTIALGLIYDTAGTGLSSTVSGHRCLRHPHAYT